ncbi:hypothetical protein FNV43_RR03091 [Rhamnella rubrinervis]|uniref:Cation/H+ exchanger domain-containing protein n=1 Tax=Rhamnella rubrinervis TaxID=2594499 RepID=A0A8K0HIG0_9ROSA|nr:hypothetical protein FNV43_RR03091 [Rhamnella rubrinervis]
MLTLETLGNLSLIYYLFLVGLEVDIKPILRAGKKPLSIALVGLIIPIPIGYALHKLATGHPSSTGGLYSSRMKFGSIFWGIALATTNFPDLARILADLKLLHSEVGRIALSSAVITDLFSWILLVLSIAMASDGEYVTIAASIGFALVCLFALRPALAWLISRTSKDESYNEYHIGFVLASVPLFGYLTDSCGCESMLGAFMLGVIMPKGELKNTLMEKVEDFVSGLMMPLFFLIIGLRTNRLGFGNKHISVGAYIIVVVLSFSAKVVSTFFAAVFMNNMSMRDGLALGLLMNTKGLLALIIISAGRDLKVLSFESFTVMISSIWLMTTLVAPILARTYKPSKSLGTYNRRTINSVERDDSAEFRILTCIHNQRNISSLVNILEASNATRQSPISAFAVHLVENTGRAAAMLIVHDTCKTDKDEDDINKEPPSNYMTNSFENLEIRNGGITVQQLTVVSSYSTIHEDICSLAEDKKVSLIIVPFHNQSTVIIEGATSSENNAHSPLRDVNKNVLDNAQCSVAVFVDRGLTTLQQMDSSHGGIRRHFYMLFIGGADDRDALAYAWRMSKVPRTNLTVIRFLPGDDVIDQPIDNDNGDEDNEEILNADNEKPVDDDYIKQFIAKSRNCENVEFVEKIVSNGDEIVKEVGGLEEKGDLYIVGRGKKRLSPLTAGLSELTDCPELGPLGDILVTSSFMAESSVLIVQQGTPSTEDDQYAANGGQLKEHTAGRMTWQVQEIETPEFAPFVHRRGRNGMHDTDHL